MNKIKENDFIVRTWPSGKKTMGKAISLHGKFSTPVLYFESLETYFSEGGVLINNTYGEVKNNYCGIPQRLAAKKEINWFNKYKTLTNYKEKEIIQIY